MADLKLSDLPSASSLTDNTFFYAVQDGVSVQFSANIIAENLINPILRGAVVLEGVQLIKSGDQNLQISLDKSRTEFDAGPFVIYPDLPNGNKDGLVKILTLANVEGGAVELTTFNSNIYPNVSVTMDRRGDSIMLVYSSNSYSNGWVIIGTTPGLKTSLELDEANVTDERIRRALSAGDETIRYDEANGKIFIGDLSNIITDVSLANVTTDDLREGVLNLYFTNARAVTALTPDLDALRKPNANVIYVSKNGDDALDGYIPANAIANIHVALNRIAQDSNTFWTVQVTPGDYTLFNNPVTIPARCSLIGNDLRTTTIRPENPTVDMFYVNNGIYVFGFTFRGHRAANPALVKNGPAVFSYNPDGSAGNIITSPYIQNCSSITTTGTGIRVNGDYVGGLRSMVLDAFTQFNEGGIGIHLLNQGYMQLVSLFTICCEYSVLCEDGGFGSITNSNSSFGRYGLVADGVSPKLYSGNVVSQVNNRTIQLYTNQKPNIQDRVIMANYKQSKCFRDTGLIVDSLAFDLAYQSNTQSRFSGLQYWSQGLINVPDQRNEVRELFEYVREISTNVVINSTAWDNDGNKPYQIANTQVLNAPAPGEANLVNNLFIEFLNIIDGGIFGVTDRIVPNKYPANTSIEIQNTANLLLQNRNFIQSEAAAFFATTYPSATYVPGRTVFDDTGEIIDSLTFDILHTGNRQTITKAILFYDYLGDTSAIQNQIVQTSAAFSFIKTFIDEILTNEPIANTYQTVYLQNTSISANVTNSEIIYVRARIDDITSIIENGPFADNTPYNIRPISLTANTDPNIVDATTIILANRDFIRAEVLEYVNQNWADISNGTRNFYTVSESSNIVSNVCTVIFEERILAVDRPLENSRVSFHQGSYLSASSHTFEYVGSGTQLNAGISVLGELNSRPSCLPYNGAVPDQELEVIESRGGAVYYTSTDHKGDFRIGNELLINRATGTINGRTFNKSLFAVMTPYILAIQ
jgi:hypothetical protein